MLDFFDWFGDLIPPRPSIVSFRTSEMPVAPDQAPPSAGDDGESEHDSVHALPGPAASGEHPQGGE